MTTEIRRAGDRYVTRAEGRTTRHSFAFGEHYDPANLGFASMIAHNDEDLPAGTGYPDHPHSELEIVTWVLAGALRHTDTEGRSEVLAAGDVQRISAGSGIVHAEVTEPGVHTRFLQTWLRPDAAGSPPSYARATGGGGSGLTQVVGPDGLGIGTAGARLFVGSATGTLRLPDAPRLHFFVADGLVHLDDDALGAGDAVRLTDQGGRGITVAQSAVLAVWAFGT